MKKIAAVQLVTVEGKTGRLCQQPTWTDLPSRHQPIFEVRPLSSTRRECQATTASVQVVVGFDPQIKYLTKYPWLGHRQSPDRHGLGRDGIISSGIPFLNTDHPPMKLGPWSTGERFWVRHRSFLLLRGYKLRPRYDPVWAADNLHETAPITGEHWSLGIAIAIDATRIHDNRKVVIKLVRTWTEELPIAQYLTSPSMMSDPRNRSVALLDVVLLPDDDEHVLIVMPMLLRFDILPFRRVGEFAEAIHQFLQGLEFMHEHNIAHMDACLCNLMMDVSKTIPKGFHFRNWWTHTGLDYKDFEFHERWAVRPVQYHYIDFGLSYQYPLGLKNMTETGSCGQDASVPEFCSDTPYDPFKVDIYQLGNVILNVTNKYEGLELFLELGRAMTSRNPTKRPNASMALRQLERLLSSFEPPDLKRRVWRLDVPPWDRFRIRYLRSISRIPLLVE